MEAKTTWRSDRLAAGLEQVEGPLDVDLGVEDGVGHRATYVHLGGVVHEYLDPGVAHQLGGLGGTDVEMME